MTGEIAAGKSQASDEKLAEELNNDVVQAVQIGQTSRTTTHVESVKDVFEKLASKVDRCGSLFFTIRRGADIFRLLSLWQRQVRLGHPEREIRIHYLGKDGIDSGAIAKEFFLT